MKLQEHTLMANTLNEKIKNSRLKLRNNIRARVIFRAIDRNTSKDFNKIINISNRIVSNLRDGSNMNKETRKSKRDYTKLTQHIMNKTIYSDSIQLNNKRFLIERDEEDMTENANINFLIRSIRADIFPKGASETKNKKSSIIQYYQENYVRKNLKFMKKKKNNSLETLKNIRKMNIKNFSEKFIQEKDKITRNINDYLNLTQSFINLPKQTLLSSRSQEQLIDSKLKKITNGIDMLNYNKKLQIKTKEQKDIPYIRFENLLKYSKSCHNISKNNKFFNKDDINAFYNKEESKKDMSNTGYLVKNLINSYKNFSCKLNKKEKKFNSLIDISIPELDEYDSIINKIIEHQKKLKEEKNRIKSKSEKLREIEVKKGNKFYNAMNDVYKVKNSEWKKEDDIQKLKIENENREKEDNIKFIRQVEKNKRFISKFCDPYSQRINYNKYLEDFSNILGRDLYTKEDIFNLTKNYFTLRNKKENKINEEIEKKIIEKKEEGKKEYLKETHLIDKEENIFKNGKDINGNNINIKLGNKTDTYLTSTLKKRNINQKLNLEHCYQEFLESKNALKEKKNNNIKFK